MTKSMRDIFFNKIYDLAKKDKDIVIVSADMAAPSLDSFRSELPDQFINVGIAEQNAILVAAGLAFAGKKPLAYAITQFICLRAIEQIRAYPCAMNLPVTIVGFGAGACYYESGPTHHVIEDISMMRTLPNIEIYNTSDNVEADIFADIAVKGGNPKYIRLDRELVEDVHGDKKVDCDKGYCLIKPLGEVNLITSGNMVDIAKSISEQLELSGIKVGIIEVFKLPVDMDLCNLLRDAENLITLEEHVLAGGLGSYILELLNDYGHAVKIKRLGFNTIKGFQHCYNYGGREAIRGEFGMDRKAIINAVKESL